MTTPLVSIVTPTRNPGHRLLRCLSSVKNQTYPNVEHLVIDAASTDSTIPILRTSGTTWKSEPDQGQSDAINKGILMASGELVGWLNADDWLPPFAIEQLVQRLSANPDAGWVFGGNQIVDGKTDSIRIPPRRARIEDMGHGNPIPQAGSLVAKNALDEIGPLDSKLHFTMDLDLWIRLLRNQFSGVREKSLIAYAEIHDSSKSGSLPPLFFIVDSVRTWLKHDMIPSASVGLGRCFAHLGKDLDDFEFDDLPGDLLPEDFPFKEMRSYMRAGWRSERIRIEYSLGPRRLANLVSPDIWTCPPVRSQILRSSLRKLSRDRFPKAI